MCGTIVYVNINKTFFFFLNWKRWFYTIIDDVNCSEIFSFNKVSFIKYVVGRKLCETNSIDGVACKASANVTSMVGKVVFL